jgi:addiction module HigA family antidote
MANEDQNEFAPVTPGEILAEEFLAGYGLTQVALARALGISPNRITEIVNNRRRVTADTALRLGLFFGTSPEFWQNLQAHYDLRWRDVPFPPKSLSESWRSAWPEASSRMPYGDLERATMGRHIDGHQNPRFR